MSVNRTVPRPALAAQATGLGAHHGVSAFVWPAPRSGGRVVGFTALCVMACFVHGYAGAQAGCFRQFHALSYGAAWQGDL